MRYHDYILQENKKMDKLDDLKMHLKEIDAKVDKAVGRDVKPIHYLMITLLIIGIASNWLS